MAVPVCLETWRAPGGSRFETTTPSKSKSVLSSYIRHEVALSLSPLGLCYCESLARLFEPVRTRFHLDYHLYFHPLQPVFAIFSLSDIFFVFNLYSLSVPFNSVFVFDLYSLSVLVVLSILVFVIDIHLFFLSFPFIFFFVFFFNIHSLSIFVFIFVFNIYSLLLPHIIVVSASAIFVIVLYVADGDSRPPTFL